MTTPLPELPRAAQQMLTDEQIDEKWRAAYRSSKAFITLETHTNFAREIESLRGITATPQGNL